MPNIRPFLQTYFRITVSFLITFCTIRVFEYYFIASKSFIAHVYTYELSGLLFDVWTGMALSFLSFFLFFPICFLSDRIAKLVLHVVHVILIMIYLALIIVFSERNIPFDHEFFTRSMKESWLTTKQMMTSGFSVYLPFIIFVGLYLIIYHTILKKIQFHKLLIYVLLLLSFLSLVFVKYSSPPENWFKQKSAYYLTCNKFNYWLKDSYEYFNNQKKNSSLSGAALEEAVLFYQENQPFEFTDKEYPLLHRNDSSDVLGSFFNLKNSPPNIVILVVEGLSKDFSGDHAYATSFTPFLDSLSHHSLTWDNFLSTAPGTFAAQPAITGSVPYASRGFSSMNIIPDHLSLIKILRKNGYWANFMIGFNTDFDNMGEYIRLQGTDMILTQYPAKYKQMGLGKEGWSMGYPDDALFSRSFEVMDSLKKIPYLNIYHTGTTHMPYRFDQKPIYDKLFDQKIKTLQLTKELKHTLKETKEVLVTFMFSDDCIKKFFKEYAKRPEYGNTIFFITGDHHIGSFPSTSVIDDYHVPLIIYSPMLKASKKFFSVNSHNNLAPTITNLIINNFPVSYKPKEVPWLGSVMDTSASFRNIHSMPFMEWSRDISDYIYQDYFLSGEYLYKLSSDLQEEPIKNDSVKNYMIRLRENFKQINKYVTENNKVFRSAESLVSNNKKLLFEYKDSLEKNIFSKETDANLMSDFKIPEGYKYLYVEASGAIYSPADFIDHHPSLRLALIDTKNYKRKFLFWTMRDFPSISSSDFIPKQWNAISTNDMFTLDDYKKHKELSFNAGVWTDSIPINFKLRELHIKIYGIKEK